MGFFLLNAMRKFIDPIWLVMLQLAQTPRDSVCYFIPMNVFALAASLCHLEKAIHSQYIPLDSFGA